MTKEEGVWAEVRKVIEHPDVILADLKRRAKAQNNGDGHKVEKELADTRKKLLACDEREKRLLSLFEYESFTREELLQRVEKVKTDRLETEKRLAQLTSIKAQTVDIASLETELNEFCHRVRESLNNCSFINKRLALDILQVQVVATPEKIDVKMAVPLEFTTIERKREYVLPASRKKQGM